jgi:hypothetical protein
MSVSDNNPPLGRKFSAFTLSVALILAIGTLHFFLPGEVDRIWPWQTTPFNHRFLGAIYLAEITAALILLRVNRWAPARAALVMGMSYTTVVTLVSFAYLDRFDLGEWSAWGWFVVYIIPTLLQAEFFRRFRHLPLAQSFATPPLWRVLLLVQFALLGGYGAGLLVAPGFFSDFWPWPIDDFHGRIYSAVFFVGAAGMFMVSRIATRIELLTVGLTEAVFGFFAVAGLIVADRSLDRVDWSAVGTWAWVGAFVVLLVLNAAVVAYALSIQRDVQGRIPVTPAA